MAEELTFSDEAAALYDQAFAHVTAYFMPFLLRAAGVAPGMRVLDIATGTGLSGGAALAAVGPTGHVTAADISPAMVAKACERLGDAPNVVLSVEDGQALPFPDESFDAVLCNLGLMFFPDPVRGLMEFRRVLRPGGRMAVSVNTVVQRSYNHQINGMIARHVPGLVQSVARTFGSPNRHSAVALRCGALPTFDRYGQTRFVLPSFAPITAAFERRRTTGQALAGLSIHPPRYAEERGAI